jgi:hypothetical protein
LRGRNDEAWNDFLRQAIVPFDGVSPEQANNRYLDRVTGNFETFKKDVQEFQRNPWQYDAETKKRIGGGRFASDEGYVRKAEEDLNQLLGRSPAQEPNILDDHAGVCNEQRQRIIEVTSSCYQSEIDRALRAAGVPAKHDYLPKEGTVIDPRVVHPVEPTDAAVDPLTACINSLPAGVVVDSTSTVAGGCGLMLCPEDQPDCCHQNVSVSQSHLRELAYTLQCMDVNCAPDQPCPCLGESISEDPVPRPLPPGGGGDPPH